jgi:hypothetical protein
MSTALTCLRPTVLVRSRTASMSDPTQRFLRAAGRLPRFAAKKTEIAPPACSLPTARDRTGGRAFKGRPDFSQPGSRQRDAAAGDRAGDPQAWHKPDVDDSESALGGGPLRVAAVEEGLGDLG